MKERVINKPKLSKMMRDLVSLLLLLYFFSSCKNETCFDWKDIKGFKLYKFDNNKSVELTTWKEIEQMRYVEADITETKELFSKSECTGNKFYIWKGERLGVVEFKNGEKRKVKISWYSSLFYDPEGKRFYEFKNGAKEEWEGFIGKYLNKLN